MLACAQGETGIDTIRVVVPCFDLTAKGQQSVRYKRSIPLLRIASGGDIVLGQSNAYVEASVARRVFGNNRFLLRGRDLLPAIESLLRDVSELVDLARKPDDVGLLVVNRIDAAKDFKVSMAPALVMDALASIDLPRRLQPIRRADGGSTSSLTVKTESWSADLYNKAIQGGAPAGTLRFEATLRPRRLHSSWARDNGGKIVQVADITEGKVESLARATFDYLRFGMTVRGETDALHVIADADLSDHDKVYLAGFVEMRRRGLLPSMSSKTRKKYNDMITDLGLLVPAVTESPRSGTFRLESASDVGLGERI